MKKIFLLIFSLINIACYSQHTWGPSKETFDKGICYLELMGGTIFPSMQYFENNYSEVQPKLFLAKTAGITLRYRFREAFSFSTQFSYREQGVSIPESNYRLNSKNINLFIPIEFDYNVFKLKSKGRPMLVVFAGPYVANSIGGEITLKRNSVPISANELAKWDYGIEGGLGFRIPTFSADGGGNLSLKVSYYLGLKNTLPKSILGYNDLEMKQYLLTTTGSRMNRGIRFSFGYEFSLEKKKRTTFTAGGDGKHTYKRYVIVK